MMNFLKFVSKPQIVLYYLDFIAKTEC